LLRVVVENMEVGSGVVGKDGGERGVGVRENE
jgi:hypothetical protein